MLDNKTLWNKALVDIELTVSKANFSTWFKSTFIMKQEDGTVFIAVPNEFVKDWLKNKYHRVIVKSLRSVSSEVRALEYIISRETEEKDDTTNEESIKKGLYDDTNAELPLQDLYINREDNLNPRYVFENMVIGGFNELACAAAQAVVKQPGTSYNPLYIYGHTGLGKTHMTQAIGNAAKKAFPNKTVHYIPSEKFALDYVNALHTNKTNAFKEKYRKYDMIIMDDVQFVAGKEKTQEELFHLFNAMYEENKQIIFSSDVHPNYMPGLEERLKSRFSAGMIVNIDMPEYESRAAIVENKARANNFSMPKDIVDHVALTLQCNIRELEGVINSLVCHSRLKNRPITLTEVRRLIKNTTKQKRIVSVKDVIEIVSRYYNIEENDIYQKTRRKEVVKPRQVAMYLMREDLNISFPTIGEKMGGRDHTTVMHSYEKIKNDLRMGGGLVQEIEQLRAMFR